MWPISHSIPSSRGTGLGIQEIGELLGHTGGILGYGSAVIHDPLPRATLAVVATLGATLGRRRGDLISAQIADLLFPNPGFATFAPSRAPPVP